MNKNIYKQLLKMISKENLIILNEILSFETEEDRYKILKKYKNKSAFFEEESFILSNDYFLIEIFSENIIESKAIEDLITISIRSNYIKEDYEYIIYSNINCFYGIKQNNTFSVVLKSYNDKFNENVNFSNIDKNIIDYIYKNINLSLNDLNSNLNLLFDADLLIESEYKKIYNVFKFEKNILEDLKLKGLIVF